MLSSVTQQRKKLHGIHYTPKSLADRLAFHMVGYLPKPAGSLRILDPAVGEGELLSALVNACVSRKIDIRAEGFDTDESAIVEARSRLEQLLPVDRVRIKPADFLISAHKPTTSTLFSE